MILIADSGSTNTNWCLADEQSDSPLTECHTSGINPFYQNKRTILHLLQKEFTLKINKPARIYFYGAGCSGEDAKNIVDEPLQKYFHPEFLSVESDLMAAAHSLCQHDEGIACILGTGSNSCYYNGKEITRHVPSLGYILGDEGSGADIGRRLVSDILKKQLPSSITERFYITYAFTPEQILEHVYKNPFPNRFLARYTTFVAENIAEPSLHNLVKNGFNKFFHRNIRQYPQAHDQPVHFTGSIAFFFQDILKESAAECGFRTGIITRSPMAGLIKYHSLF
jgi:glucosamine kinase